MTKTVDEGFRTFLGRLTPSSSFSEAAKNHRASIEARLKQDFDLVRFFRTGSYGNGTSMQDYSDVDYFASIPRKKLKQNSDYTLRQVRDALDARFPNSGVTIDTPAVLVPFGRDASESTEVVPADYIETNKDGHFIYEIADRAGGWMKTSPDAHNAYVAKINEKIGGKVKPLIRFLKAWKYYKNVPILSFYLELRVAKYAEGETSIVYSIDIKNILKLLSDSKLAAMQDPAGISGYIYPCSTDAKKDDALSKLSTALTRAQNARDAEAADKIKDAFDWWDLLYDNKFPSYY